MALTPEQLLKQISELNAQKAQAIQALLLERTSLEEATKNRLAGITAELKALGYKIPRKPKQVLQAAA